MQNYLLTGIALLLAVGCGGTSAPAIPDAGADPGQAGNAGGTVPTGGGAIAADASDTFFPDASTGQGTTGTVTSEAGGAPPWAFTYSGSVMGLAFHPEDATGYVDTSPGGAKASAGVKSELYVVFADTTGLCATGIDRQNATVFSIDVLSGDATLAPGTFTEMQQEVPGQADVSVSQLSASCSAAGQDFGSASGNVVLTSVSATEVSGTFSVELLQGAGTLAGSFTVPLCGHAPSTSCKP